MNFAGLVGVIAAISIAAFSIVGAAKDNPKIFMDMHGIVLVIGGTMTVMLLAFPFKRIFAALKIVTRKMLGRDKVDYFGTIRTIVELSVIYRTDPKKALEALPKSCHPFLADGIKLLVEYGFSYDETDAILANGLRGKRRRDEEEVKFWHTASRFPPAFGLLGATLGMIALLQTLGEPGAQDRIGPAMATALVATFYGLVVANLVLIPIAEKLADVSSSDQVLRSIIHEGVLLIHEKRHPVYIEEYLKSFLSPGQRQVEMQGSSAGDSGRAAA